MRLLVIGGGYSGVSMAVQAARRAHDAIAITVVEPATALGRGLAYSTTDPDHRINGPMGGHSVDLNDLEHPNAWVRRVGLLTADPEIETPEGYFPRRADFSRYLADAFAEQAADNPSDSTLTHIRARAIDIEDVVGAGLDINVGAARVHLDDGRILPADAVVLATGNPPPRVPPALAELADHPAMMTDPWDRNRLQALSPEARLVLMGTGLTAADMLATLVRQGHRGSITVFSRRGLRPRSQRPLEPTDEPLPPTWLIDRINGVIPAYLEATSDADRAFTVRGLVRAVRRRIDEVQGQGRVWHAGFDELRDVVWQLWTRLSLVEKKRFLTRVRPWYDVHRFRMAPQTEALLAPAIAAGQITFHSAGLVSVASTSPAQSGAPLAVQLRTPDGSILMPACDGFINCTGLDSGFEPAAGSLLARLQARGSLTRDPSGIGYAVDHDNRIVRRDGQAHAAIRLIGPPTAGHFGDPLGVLFIAAQIHRMLPSLLATRTTS